MNHLFMSGVVIKWILVKYILEGEIIQAFHCSVLNLNHLLNRSLILMISNFKI